MNTHGGSSHDGDDGALLRDVRTMLRNADPPPPDMQEAAHGLLAWRAIDAALDQLLCSGDTAGRCVGC
jgi:hypothetical protein